MEEMKPMKPLTKVETKFEKRINSLIYAYNNSGHLGMKCMWRDKVLELTKKIVHDSQA